jgi:hypothetical protein
VRATHAPTPRLQHPGGEFKGIQPVYGANGTNDNDLLFGAKKPHKPFNFSLGPGEVGAAVVARVL